MAMAAEKPESEVVLKDFGGLVTRADRLDLPPGIGADQKNVMSTVIGQLNVRPGMRQVKFQS
jgi:hypothetical protein